MAPPQLAARLLVAALAALLGFVMIRLAWLGDDAFITLRSVENVLAGHGPVWNVGERVQTYTHPLWMWLLVVARWVTGEAQLTVLVVSMLLSGAVALVLARHAGRAAAVVLVLLLASRAFGDYTTSGLETPLAMLLLAWLAWLDARSPEQPPQPLRLVLVTALLGTTRLDLLALAVPVLCGNLRGVRPARLPRLLVVGLAPLWAWSAFAWFYYGSPFPITAYAKAFSNGVPATDLLPQGLHYVGYSLRHDPVTLVTIVAGVLVGSIVRPVRGRMLALGIVLYCGYVVRVGGDFMAGRFFVPPLVAATALLARWLRDASVSAAAITAAGALVLMFVPGLPPWACPIADDLAPVVAEHGIADERRFYYGRWGLLSPQRDVVVAGDGTRRLREEGRRAPLIVKYEVAGRDPFVAGELFHVVDRWLVDPLLMRLPIQRPGAWRIGHFTRGIPTGYLASLAFGDNRLEHAGLRACYDDLRLVLRAPLFARERLAAWWRLTTGAHADGLRAYVESEYRTPRRRELAPDWLRPGPVAEGTFWFDEPRIAVVDEGGLGIDFGAPQSARALRASLSPLARYRLAFFAGGEPVGAVEVDAGVAVGAPPAAGGLLDYLRGVMGMRDYVISVPESARTFDRLELDCVGDARLVPAVGGFEGTP